MSRSRWARAERRRRPEEKKPQKKNNQKQAEKLERKNEGGAQQTQRRRRSSGKKQTVRIVPLGGLNEIGKNMTVYECGNDMFIVDCGLAFPDETMLGVDIVIPDFTYVVENRDRIRGVFITHGHEDHIGGIPYLMKEINAPIYATKLTVGLIKNKLKEHGLVDQVQDGGGKAGRRHQGRLHVGRVYPRQPLHPGRLRAGHPHPGGRHCPDRRL